MIDDNEPAYVQYLCYLSSVPGMWASYDGYVEVHAPSDAGNDAVFEMAVRTLARTSFPDRPSLSSWRLDRIERV